MRFDTNMQAGVRLLRDGAIGDLRMMRVSGLTPGYDMGHKTWIAEPENGGALLDWGSHAFDLLRHFADADPLRLSAEVTQYGDAPVGESSAMALIAYPNDVMASLWMSYELPKPGLDSPFKLWIVGSKGILELQRFGQSRMGRGDSWEVISDDGEANWEIERRHDPVRVKAPARQIQDWVDAIRAGRPSSAPAEAGPVGGDAGRGGAAVVADRRVGAPAAGGLSRAPTARGPLRDPADRYPPGVTTTEPSAPFRLLIERDVRVPMRDGVTLAAEIYRPDTTERLPVLIERTPYDRHWMPPGDPVNGLALAEAGYVVVMQDCRGRFDSEGEFEPFLTEAAGRRGRDRLVRRPALVERHGRDDRRLVRRRDPVAGRDGGPDRVPALKAIAPYVSASDYHEGWVYQGGAFQLGFSLYWSLDSLALAAPAQSREAAGEHLHDEIAAVRAGHGRHRPALPAPAAAGDRPDRPVRALVRRVARAPGPRRVLARDLARGAHGARRTSRR